MATPLSQITATSSPSSSHAVPTASHPLYTIPPPPYTPTDSIAPAPTASVSGGASTSGSSGPGQPVETAVSFIAFLGIVIAILYTIHKVRRDRRLRRLALEGDQSHLENGGVHRGTNRPEDVDEAGCPPPQYRAYVLDQPYTDPEMTVAHPEQAHNPLHLATQRTRGPRDSLSSQHGLLSSEPSSEPTTHIDPTAVRPILTTVITTTTTTTTTTTLSPPTSPVPRSIAAPNANIPNEITQSSAGPVISAPSPTFSFASARQASILRAGLGGSNNMHQSARRGSAANNSSPEASTEDQMTELRGNSSRPGILQPALNRLRSQGPPPYIPLAPEEAAPQLPPEYI